MLRSIAGVQSLLGVIVITAIVLCKIFDTPKLYLLTLVVVAILYQMVSQKISKRSYNFDDVLINVGKFIIITGIIGVVFAKILEIFLLGK